LQVAAQCSNSNIRKPNHDFEYSKAKYIKTNYVFFVGHAKNKDHEKVFSLRCNVPIIG